MANKYGAIKTKVDGITFDSRLEARFYEYVKDLRMNGKIGAFDMQVRYELLPKYTRSDGKKIRCIEYVADFVIDHLDGTTEIVDVKGVETDVFKLKRKLFESKYPYVIQCVTHSRLDGGWITLEDLKVARKKRKASK